MKYLVVKLKRTDTEVHRFAILEEAQRAYESAKKQEGVLGVYWCAILKEIDL